MEKEFIVIAGSGISKASPSNLPSWWDYNMILLEELNKSAAKVLPEEEQPLTGNLMEYLPVVSVSDFLMRGAMGNGYYPLLKILEGTRPNNIHYGLAELANRNRLKAIITTNFDTLIEQAFRQKGVPYNVLISEEDYLSRGDNGICSIVKIHGSVENEKSLIDTVTQKMKGLPDYKKDLLEEYFRLYPTYVLGFSGEDFRFGNDYLPINVALKNHEVNWIVYPGSRPGKYISKLISNKNCHVQEITLEDWLDHFGVVPTLINEKKDNTGKEYIENSRVIVREAMEQPSMGPYANMGLAIALLKSSGKTNRALDLSKRVVDRINGKEFELNEVLTLIIFFTNAGLVFMEAGDFDNAENMFKKEKAIITAIYMLLSSNGVDNKENKVEELMNLGSVVVNLGLNYTNRKKEGDYEKAFNEYNEFIRTCLEQPDDIVQDERVMNVLIHIELSQQKLLNLMGASLDFTISCFKDIVTAFRKVGNADKLLEALSELSRYYLLVGEYDSAEECLNEYQRYMGVGKRKLYEIYYLLRYIELRVRRHQEINEAFNEFKSKVVEFDENERIWKSLFEICNGAKDYSEVASECLSKIERKKEKGSSSLVEEYYKHLAKIDSSLPVIVIPTGNLKNLSYYEQCKKAIILNEYYQNYDMLIELWNNIPRDELPDDRIYDINFAFYKAVLRHDVGILRLEARLRYSEELIRSKKYENAIDLCDEIINAENIKSVEFETIKGRAYGVKSGAEELMGHTESSKDNYQKAYDLLSLNIDCVNSDLKVLVSNRAKALNKSGKTEEAIKCIDKDWINKYGEDADMAILKKKLENKHQEKEEFL